MDWGPLLLTFKLALITTCILLVIGLPLAHWLAYSKIRFKFIVKTLVTMPLVLPPSVLGFYLLILFNPEGWLGKWIDYLLGIQLIFSFEGIILGSVIFSLPFMVNTVQSGFENIPISLIESAYTLGKSSKEIFFAVLLPNMRPAIFAAVIMSFAHTIGEFGVVLMIGGNIPNETRVASLAIYTEVEALNYHTANFYALILLIVSFSTLLVMNLFNKNLE